MSKLSASINRDTDQGPDKEFKKDYQQISQNIKSRSLICRTKLKFYPSIMNKTRGSLMKWKES